MSTDSGRPEAAVPSFGELFDEPEPAFADRTPGPDARPDEPGTDHGAAQAPDGHDEPEPHDVEAAPGTTDADATDDDAPDDDAPEDEAPPDEVHDPQPPTRGSGSPDRPEDDLRADVVMVAASPRPGLTPEVLDEVPAVAAVGSGAALAAAATASGTGAEPNAGRLYRSAGAEGPATLDAIPAIDPEYLAGREARPTQPRRDAAAPRPARVQGGSGLTWTGVVVVVVLGTVLVAFADALINNSLGLLTGLALLVSSVYCAVLVRPADIWAAAIIPPLGFLAAVLTAGQLTLEGAGSLLVREGYMIVKTLAQNAPWIIGTTLVCLVIVIVRRRRASHA